MTEVIHGLISGLIWSAILGSCLIAIATVITAAVPARAKVRHTAAGTTHTLAALPLAERARLGRAGAVASHSGVPQFACFGVALFDSPRSDRRAVLLGM